MNPLVLGLGPRAVLAPTPKSKPAPKKVQKPFKLVPVEKPGTNLKENIAKLKRNYGSESLPNTKDNKVMHPDRINRHIKEVEYAVRGELYLRGEELRKQGREITFTNVGNPQALGAKPLTFPRQVISLITAPFLLDHPLVDKIFPKDAIARAKHLLSLFKVGVGAYTDSRGCPGIREEVAEFIKNRDGHDGDAECIFLTDGASVGVRLLLNALIRNQQDCILVPIPQYPLYSASIALYGGNMMGYYLDEGASWSMRFQKIKEQVKEAREQGKVVRAIAFINPGNPTGQCMTKENLEDLIKFAKSEQLVLLADEVYQENIYQDEHPFHSCHKVLMDMGEPYASQVELVSFHSVSKGVGGECGLRGGYFHMKNVHPETVGELYKIVSVNLCPNTIGQVAVSLLVNQPKAGEASHDAHKQEVSNELASLKRRAQMVTEAFNGMKNVSCNPTEGAMYAFPRLHLPLKAIKAAEEAGKAPDAFYCLKLLEATGISTVPGSGFGQEPDTWHLRTTILPREEKMQAFCQQFRIFNEQFMAEYADEEPAAASIGK
eukprot:g2573.t1